MRSMSVGLASTEGDRLMLPTRYLKPAENALKLFPGLSIGVRHRIRFYSILDRSCEPLFHDSGFRFKI